MATKGASNHYGNSRNGRPGRQSKFISYKWARDFNNSTLNQHFEDHGKQVRANSVYSYAAKAVHFANEIDRKNNVSFVDKNNSTYKYDKSRNLFAIIKANGIVVTFFSPTDGYDYYLQQKKKYGGK